VSRLSSGEQDRPTEPSADEVTDPTLQAEIGNPAATNQPTGAEAAPGDDTTAADEGGIAAPGAPGELHSDEAPPQGEGAGDAPAPTTDDAAATPPAGDETGAAGVQGRDAVNVTPEVSEPAPISAYAQPAEPAEPAGPKGEAEAAPAAAAEQPPAATTPEQPPAAPEPEAAPAQQEPELPVEPQAEADAAAAESTEVAEGERAGDDVPPVPDQVELSEIHQQLADELRAALDDAVVDTWARPSDEGDLWVRVDVARWREAAEAAKALGFTYFCYLSAIDWLPSPFGKSEDGVAHDADQVRASLEEGLRNLEHGVTGGETRFQLLARVYSIARRVGITFKADLPDDGPVAETWSGVYAGANWMERETHEMFGIGFAGHPYLVNLYLPGAFEGHPLRKDFPLLAREVKPWPGLVDVEAMPGEAPTEEPAAAGTEA
jgi:NADH-quinone oxidoreductase subunit C